jgi:hypothetical protein
VRAFSSVLVVLLSIAPAFNTPSGNIQCTGGIGDGIAADVYCTIFDRSGPPSTARLAQCNDAPGYATNSRCVSTVP